MTVPVLQPPSTDAPSRDQEETEFDNNMAGMFAYVATLWSDLNDWIEAIMPLATAIYGGTSTTSVVIGTGSKSFTTSTGRGWIAGQTLRIVDSTNAANYMLGTVTSYDSSNGALVFNSTAYGGSGTKTAWDISLEMAPTSLLQLLGYTENVVDPAAAAAFSPDLSQGTMFNYDTNANTVVTMPTATVGLSFSMRVTYGGAHTLGFTGATIEWDRGIAPVASSTLNAVDVYAFSCFEAGIWTGFDGGRSMA